MMTMRDSSVKVEGGMIVTEWGQEFKCLYGRVGLRVNLLLFERYQIMWFGHLLWN